MSAGQRVWEHMLDLSVCRRRSLNMLSHARIVLLPAQVLETVQACKRLRFCDADICPLVNLDHVFS